MASSFKDLRIVDNFYQTSAFFPMPTLLISTLDEEGNTTMGAYSLCFHRQARLPGRNVPVDYGYRDSTYFWYTRFRRPRKEPIPAGKEMAVDSVIFAANRIDPEIKFTKEACQMCVKIPRVFLKAALTQMVDYARDKGWKLIDVPQLKEIQDKRSKEKNQRRR